MSKSLPKLNRTKRLAIAALAGALGALGPLVGCARSESRPNPANQHQHQLQDSDSTYQSEVKLSRTVPLAKQIVSLDFHFRDGAGNAIRDLPQTHEKPIHVLIISENLRHFAHGHPVAAGEYFRLAHTFEEPGGYFLFVDYLGPNRTRKVDRHRVRVGGGEPEIAPLTESLCAQQTDGLQFKLRTEAELRAGKAALLHFDVTTVATGAPATDLEPYLGAKAHFVVLSSDGEDFVHVHAIDGGDPAQISAHAVFPREGLYKLWVQVKQSGRVVTVPLVVRVRPNGQVGS